MSPQANHPIPSHHTPPVGPASVQSDGRTPHQDSTPLDVRDALTDLLFVQLDRSEEVYDIAGAILAAGFRPPAQVITNPDTPDEFPCGSIGVDRDGVAWVSTYTSWVGGSVSTPEIFRDIVADFGPITIVHIPTETGDTE